MKSNFYVKTAVASALLASVAGTASAVTPSADNFLRVGGATATNGAVLDLFLNSSVGLCTSNVDVYFSATTETDTAKYVGVAKGSTGQLIVTCTSRAFATDSPYASISSVAIGYAKESSAGGSANGTGAVANQTALPFLSLANVTSGSPSCAAGQAVSPAGGLLGFTFHKNCSVNDTVAPEIGFADVEGRLLAFTGSGLTSSPFFDVVFGVPVSLPFYRALQTAQGKPTNDTCAAVPSLTKGQIAGLYTGQVYSASVLGLADTSDIHLCRRGNGSGTQAGAKAYFVGENCAANVLAFTPPAVGDPANGTTWIAADLALGAFAGSGGGEVQKCLHAFANNTTGSGTYAVGVLSTENGPLITSLQADRKDYRFVRINGALPTIQATANGEYEYFTSNLLNTRTATDYTDQETAIVEYLKASVSNPAIVAAANAGFQGGVCQASGTVFGDGGVLASAPNAATLTLPAGFGAPFSGQDVRDFPLNTQSKQPSGTINNCQPSLTYGMDDIQAPGGSGN